MSPSIPSPVWAEALALLQDHDRLRDLAIAVQQIPSPTDEEGAAAEWVSAYFTGLGIGEVFTDERQNVYARIPGEQSQPALMVSAHTDTVFPTETDLTVRINEAEKLIFGPSIGDNSVGVAALLRLAESLTRLSPPPVDIWLVANSGEEGLGDLRGMKAAVDRLQDRLGASVVIEGMGLGRIVHQGLGSRRYRVSVNAPGGHSWSDFGSLSAIHLLTQIAAQISTWQVPATPRTTFNIGKIRGGTSVNTIAQNASFELDLRSEEPSALQAQIAKTEALIAQFTTDQLRAQGGEVTLEIIGDRPSGQIPANHPLAQMGREALQACGVENFSLRTSSTDANVPLSRGIPAICVGITEGGGAHRMEEWINSALIPQGAQHLLLLTWRTANWLAGS